MQLLDRPYQLELLRYLATRYPVTTAADFIELELPGATAVNLAYLHEHGLVRLEWHGDSGMGAPPRSATITARGMDFLADDGGLSAILGVVTVKLHDEMVRTMVENKILASNLSEPEKKRFRDQLRELPGETTKHLVIKMVDAGLDNWQKALPLLQNILGP